MSRSGERVFGARFQATRRLKAGLGVETLLGVDLRDRTPVVIKAAATAQVSPSVERRLEHEASVLRSVRGPWLTPLLAVGREGDDLYLVMPYVPGPTLEARLAAGPLSVKETLAVGRSLLAALREVHEHGILHRDLKPANVILGDETPVRRAVLIDFGLARSGWLGSALRNVPVGTLRYMSPEQAGILDRGVDGRSDLYSLGVVLYECLAGRPPFDSDSAGELLRLHLTARAPELRSLGLPMPAALDDVVQRLVRKDPRDRYQTAEAAQADLEEIAEALDRGIAEPVVAVGARDRRRVLTEPAFIGRRGEVEAFDAALERTRQGAGDLTLLEAESGGGKTRLLDEFAGRGAQKGAWLLRGQGEDQASPRPFQVLADVVEEVVAAAAAEPAFGAGLRERLGDHAEAVAVLFPQLRPALGGQDGGSLGPEEFAEARGVPALAAFLDALGTPERPAVVLLDDCQWADELSLRLLARWHGRPGGERRRRHAMLVVAFRSEEVPAGHLLRGLAGAERLVLPSFGEADVRDLVESMAGPVPDQAAASVARLAEGSPFMASAVLRGLVEAGALVHAPTGWQVDPEALAAAQASRRAATFLARRLDLLPGPTRALLSVGAVLGKEFDLALAMSLSGQEAPGAMVAAGEARRRHLVWADASGARCTFVHDKVREALLDRLDPAERRALHFQAARRLEAAEPERVFDLAYHFDAAGESGRALPYALAAAGSARGRYALAIAEQYYRIALRGTGAADEATRRQAAEGLGDVLLLRGQYEEAARHMAAARALARDDVTRAALEGKLGELAFKQGDMRAASEAIERALGLLGRSVPRSAAGYVLRLAWEVGVQALHTLAPRMFLGRRPRAGADAEFLAMRLYSRLAYSYWFQRGRVPCGWAHLREMNLAERYPPSAELAQAYSEHAPVMTMVPAFRRGIAYAERSLAIRRSLGDVWGQGQSLHFYGVVLYAASRFAECIDKCREAVRLLERTGDRWEVNTASWHIAFSLYRLGQIPAAVEASRAVFQAGQEIGDRQACGISLGVWAKASGGRVPAGLVREEVERPSDDVHTGGEVLQAEALRLLGEGRPAEAVAVLERAQARVDAAGLRQEYVAPILPWLVTALRHQVEATPPWAAASRRALLRRAGAVARRARRVARPYRNNRPHALRESALLAAMQGRPRRAERWLAASLAEARHQGAEHEAAQTLLARGQLGRELGWPGAAEQEAEARGRLGALGADPGIGRDRREEAATPFLAERFATLLDVGRRIAASRSRQAIFAAVHEAAATLLRGETCLVLEAVAGGRDFRPVAGDVAAAHSRTVVARAVEVGRPVVVAEGFGEDPAQSVVLSGVRSALCAPFFVGGVAAGCVYMTHGKIAGLFVEDDERVAEFITVLAGAALEHADAFAEIEALLGERQRAEERFRTLIENGSDLITVLGADGTVRYLGPSVQRILGYRVAELVGTSLTDLVHADDVDAVRAVLAAAFAEPGEMQVVECRARHRDGSWRWLEAVGTVSDDASGTPVAIVNGRDVSERRTLEGSLRQAHRLEAVGKLAGGVAHDFNNLLTVILGRINILLAGRGEDDPLRRHLEMIQQASDRAADLTRQLLAFSRRQLLQPRLLDLNEVLAAMEPMLRRLAGEGVTLVVGRAPDLGLVKADPGQIEQVVTNLVVNACDAMRPGGLLTIETGNVDLDEAYVRRHPDARVGPHARLSVSDSGAGMDAETMGRIFEPFFTTKGVGKGIGLGLSSVHGIVSQSGGHVEVQSAPGQGTRFSVYLPRVGAIADAARPPAGDGVARGSETILVVEGDDGLRDLIREVLEESGYAVLAVRSGREALEWAAAGRGPIHMLLTDVAMPGMTGPELTERLLPGRPDLRVLYMSAYLDESEVGAGAPDRGIVFLQKPFSPATLGRTVRAILDVPPGAARPARRG